MKVWMEISKREVTVGNIVSLLRQGKAGHRNIKLSLGFILGQDNLGFQVGKIYVLPP
jgi:hypothetical protein